MKDYERIILWLDYFNSKFSRSCGRRVPLNLAVSSPTLEELVEAARRLGYQVEAVKARYPKRNWEESGYISIPKTKNKTAVIKEISKMLSVVRGMRRQKD
ncbi:MAG: signal recognition particle subunit SRP19/SEC65 family protein [Conexivisphaerales archaeon]